MLENWTAVSNDACDDPGLFEMPVGVSHARGVAIETRSRKSGACIKNRPTE